MTFCKVGTYLGTSFVGIKRVITAIQYSNCFLTTSTTATTTSTSTRTHQFVSGFHKHVIWQFLCLFYPAERDFCRWPCDGLHWAKNCMGWDYRAPRVEFTRWTATMADLFYACSTLRATNWNDIVPVPHRIHGYSMSWNDGDQSHGNAIEEALETPCLIVGVDWFYGTDIIDIYCRLLLSLNAEFYVSY